MEEMGSIRSFLKKKKSYLFLIGVFTISLISAIHQRESAIDKCLSCESCLPLGVSLSLPEPGNRSPKVYFRMASELTFSS